MRFFKLIALLLLLATPFSAAAMEPLTIYYSANTYGVAKPCPS